jgi:hypothetical protein
MNSINKYSSFFAPFSTTFSLALYASINDKAMAMSLVSYLFNTNSYPIFILAVGLLTSFLFITAGSRHNRLAKVALWLTKNLGNFCASTAGTILGLSWGVCAGYFLDAPIAHFYQCFLLLVLTISLVLPPLLGLHVSASSIEELNKLWEKSQWRIHGIQICGYLLLALTVAAFVDAFKLSPIQF